MAFLSKVMLLLVIYFIFSSQTVYSVTVSSVSDGYWISATTWNGDIVPAVVDDVIIDSEVTIAPGTTVEINSLTISKNGKLIVYGTLIIHGDLVMDNNGSELITGSGASVFIFGSALLDNRVELDLSSYFIVLGDFLKTGADNQGSISATGAHIYVFGSINSSWEDFTACPSGDYGGTTDSITADCDAGQYDDFIENVGPEDLPDGIYQQIVGCDPLPTAVISGDAIQCDDGLTATLTIAFTGTSPWRISIFRDGEDTINVENINVNPYAFQVSVAGTYTLSSMSDAVCTGTVSGSATIVFNPLPLTGQIIPD